MFVPRVAKAHNNLSESSVQKPVVHQHRAVHEKEKVANSFDSMQAKANRRPSWDLTRIPVYSGADDSQGPSWTPAPRPLPAIQAKLRVGQKDDAYEQEADRIAEAVVAGAVVSPHFSGRVSTLPASSPLSGAQTAGPLQGKCQDGEKCGECQECKQKASLRRKPVGDAPGNLAPPLVVHEVLRSPGAPLGRPVRDFFEPGFGRDFSQVRVHDDARAAESANAIQAHAYTVGQDIVFGSGEYAPETATGRSLIAHELTHVVQQDHAGTTPHVIRRMPWGTCPEGPRANNRNPFVYGAAEAYAILQYAARFAGHCMFTNMMLAANELPKCDASEQPVVDAITRRFHRDKWVKRQPVQSPGTVTDRAEADKIMKAVEMVAALQQPDILDVTAREVYDITTVKQRDRKSNKFRTQYLPILNSLGHGTWRAGTKLMPFTPESYTAAGKTICYGPTDFARWPGVIQYEAIETEKKQGKKGKKKKEEKEEKEEKKKTGKGKNVGFGLGILSSGGGSSNAVLGVAINSHGQSYGTVSAGIVYDADGNAIGVASAGVGAHMSGNQAGAVAAGAAARTSGDSALTAAGGTSKDANSEALAAASLGKNQGSSVITVATATKGSGKDADGFAAGKAGKAGSDSAPGQKHAGDHDPDVDAQSAAASQGIQIPGQTASQTNQAVKTAAEIDALLQKATPAQKHLIAYLAQTSEDSQYTISGADWLRSAFAATAGLSDADLAFLETQQWRPGKVTPEELRKQIDVRLKNRATPQGNNQDASVTNPAADKKADSQSTDGKTDPKAQDKRSSNKAHLSPGADGPDKKIQGGSLDPTTSDAKPETTQEAVARLYKRVKNYRLAKGAPGLIDFGKAMTYGQASGALYFHLTIGKEELLVTADVSGILTEGKTSDEFEVRSIGLLVSSKGGYDSGDPLLGMRFSLKK